MGVGRSLPKGVTMMNRINRNNNDKHMSLRQRLSLRNFLKRKSGAITVEYIIWLPFFAALVVFIFDVSMTMQKSSRMWDVARDAARSVATGGNIASAKANILSSLSNSGSYIVTIDNFTDPEKVVVTIDAVGSSGDVPSALDQIKQVDLYTKYTMRNEM